MNRDTIATEYMKIILSTDERLGDYLEEKDIMKSIAVDAYKMADAMEKASVVKVKKNKS